MENLATPRSGGKPTLRVLTVTNTSSATPSPTYAPSRAIAPTPSRISGLNFDSSNKEDPSREYMLSIKKTRDIKTSKLPRKSIESAASPTTPTSPTSPCEISRPATTRKVSGLDYDGQMAMPMAKPRGYGRETPDIEDRCEDPKRSLEKQPSFIEGCPRADSPTYEWTPTTPESKKKWNIQLLRSKLSFKDLEKEVSKKDISNPIPVSPFPQLHENKKQSLRRPLNSALTMPSIASTIHQKKVRPSMDKNKPIPGSISTKSGISATTNTNHTPSRIPLPPSNTLSHAQGVMSNMKTSNVQQDHPSLGQRPPSYSSSASKRDSENSMGKDSNFATPSLDACEKIQQDVLASRPNTTLRCSPRNVVNPFSGAHKYPVTSDSPPCPSDLLEGNGKVKYIPKAWLDEASPSSSSPRPRDTEPDEASGKRNGTRIGSTPSRVPTLKERFEKSKPYLEGPGDLQSRNAVLKVDELVDMVRSVQRHADTAIEGVSKKLEQLSTWITEQLNQHIKNITDLSSDNSDLCSKQSTIAQEILNFQLSISLEIKSMERRLSDLEMHLVNNLKFPDKIRLLAKSYEELNLKTDALIQNSSADETKRFMDVQRMKNSEIEAEIAFLKAHTLRDASRLPPQPVATPGESSSDTLIKHNGSPTSQSSPVETPEPPVKPKPKPVVADLGVLAIAPTHPPMFAPQSSIKTSTSSVKTLSKTDSNESEIRNKEFRAGGNRSGIAMRRSVSMTKKGLLKPNKPDPPDAKDKAPTKGKTSSDEPKKWNIFGFRRRQNTTGNIATGSNNSTKGRSLSYPEAGKQQGERPNKGKKKSGSSTGSSTPPLPAIPVLFSHKDGKKETLIHPAFRPPGLRRSTSPKKSQSTVSSSLEHSSPVEVFSHRADTPTSSPIAEESQLTPRICSSVGALPSASMDLASSLASVREIETQASDSEDTLEEEQPLLGGDDGANSWSYIPVPGPSGVPPPSQI